ncbi:MAG: M20/M25/M40 family metallo-hydrolase [Bacteroidetes bacterium]|nr:M20/M25/M40 family metallo-hydrolase [Bacteroidota bacterium]
MKKIYILGVLLTAILSTHSQSFETDIETLISEVSIDSLLSNVRILSGEDSVYINGEKTLIEHRVAGWGNSLAEDYLAERLEACGMQAVRQNYSSGATNVFGTLQGSVYPEQYYMICAHYDAVTYYAADDNASGCATVLEAARLLSEESFPYSVIFAFWDEEEIGLFGSSYYANYADNFGINIDAVINIDMIAWDGNNDGLIEIHTKPVNQSVSLANFMQNINETYAVGLMPSIKNPGTTASDHSPFWNHNYSAILLIEGYYSNDFNPYYHTTGDRINHFNISYFHKSAQLAIGSLASLAMANITGTEQFETTTNNTITNYPNPFRCQTTIDINLSENSEVSIVIIDQLGRKVSDVYNGKLAKGTHQIQPDIYLENGYYHMIMQTSDERLTRKIAVVK